MGLNLLFLRKSVIKRNVNLIDLNFEKLGGAFINELFVAKTATTKITRLIKLL